MIDTPSIDTPSLVEQVIVVPKISLDRIPQRSAVRRPQKAEQLVEVPTIVSFSSLQQQTAEQIIDIPVPGRGGGGGRGGLQGFSSGQNSTARLVEQNVDIPVRSPPGVRVRGCTALELTLAAYVAKEAAYPDLEYEFFETLDPGLGRVRLVAHSS